MLVFSSHIYEIHFFSF
uniref:Uncharacterized protein n=1 Tax=Anguilla anguilla TaxID=7936 RepID=A0A0E9XYJ1_ANGAN